MMTGLRTGPAIVFICCAMVLPGAATAQLATTSPLLANTATAQAQAQGQAQAAPVAVLPPIGNPQQGNAAPGNATFGAPGSISGFGARQPQALQPRMLATDRGPSYAPPPPPLPPGVLLTRPAAAGQSSVAGERLPPRVFTATPPPPGSDAATRTIGEVPALTEASRLNPRLGFSTVRLAAGQRLGGGLDFPSREAVSYDPRDLFDYRVRALEDPAQRTPR